MQIQILLKNLDLDQTVSGELTIKMSIFSNIRLILRNSAPVAYLKSSLFEKFIPWRWIGLKPTEGVAPRVRGIVKHVDDGGVAWSSPLNLTFVRTVDRPYWQANVMLM